MPYVRSNWEGLTKFNGGHKFEVGHVHSFNEVKLARPLQAGPKGCFLHGTSTIVRVEALWLKIIKMIPRKNRGTGLHACMCTSFGSIWEVKRTALMAKMTP